MRKIFLLIILIFIINLSIIVSSQPPNTTSKSTSLAVPEGVTTKCWITNKKYGIIGTINNTRYNYIINKFYYIKITGIIDTSTENYVRYAISKAKADNAALIILLNTPGGYLEPATNIVALIDKSGVPVIGYVVDKWAESAGALIFLSTDIATMQPGTIIGSMQPVMYNPQTGTYKPINESKILNPIIALLCEHAATKGRNGTELIRFVLYNDNLGAEEALKYHVIDFIAPDMNSLLTEINGKVVRLPTGVSVALDSENAVVEEVAPPPSVVVLHSVSDPIISGLLLSLGTLIIIFSIISGHLPFAAVGALLLLLGLAGSGYNPNIVSLLLIILGSILLAVELHTPSFGIIGGVGIVMIVLGVALLPTGTGFSVPPGYANTILAALYGIGIVIGIFTAFIIYKIIKIKKKKPLVWNIVGSIGIADDDLEPGKPGFVIVEGEYWKAFSDYRIRKGEKVIVKGKDGPILIVEPIRDSE